MADQILGDSLWVKGQMLTTKKIKKKTKPKFLFELIFILDLINILLFSYYHVL